MISFQKIPINTATNNISTARKNSIIKNTQMKRDKDSLLSEV
jgi:hypothetical protein